MSKSIIISFLAIYLVNCNNSNDVETKTGGTINNTAPASEKPEETISIPPGDGLVGSWSLNKEAYDDNNNKKLDDEELAKAITNRFYYRFNEDGTCLVNFVNTSQGAFKAHYKVETVNNVQKLIVFAGEGEDPGVGSDYELISVNREELVLLLNGELVFWIFNRTNK